MKRIREKDFLDFIGIREAQYLEPASHWTDEVVDYEESQRLSGNLLPWSYTHDIIQFRPGEVTLWSGDSGAGKSLMLGQALLHWMNGDNQITLASLEMKPVATISRMIKQTGQMTNPTPEYKRAFMKWTDDSFWIYDQLDQIPHERIIGMVHYAAQELKCNIIAIDSLMKCGIDDDDYNSQKEFVDHLCWAAKNENVHIHLVAHNRKRSTDLIKAGKFDVAGSAAITNLVDNLLLVGRNKEKENAMQMGETRDDHDALLEVRKNRHGGTEGGVRLFFNGSYQQFNQDEFHNGMNIQIPMGVKNEPDF